MRSAVDDEAWGLLPDTTIRIRMAFDGLLAIRIQRQLDGDRKRGYLMTRDAPWFGPLVVVVLFEKLSQSWRLPLSSG